MSCELRWLVSVSTSAFHAAAAVDGGLQLADARLAQALSQPVADLQRVLTSTSLPAADFWNHVIPLSATIDSNRQLAEVVLHKIVGSVPTSDSRVQLLAAAMTDLERALVRTMPDLLDELELRVKPLREQWEARGPGLLTLVGQQTHPQMIVPNADVILVQPVLGGTGYAHLPYNSVTIEAVLANPHVQLPEVLRLGWMLAQLNQDIPQYGELVHGQRAGGGKPAGTAAGHPDRRGGVGAGPLRSPIAPPGGRGMADEHGPPG